jgi:hypothetical protein
MAVLTCPDGATAEQLATWLADAEAAYHRLMQGKAPRVIVDANGERVEFTSVSADSLRRYITDLQRRKGALAGCAGPGFTRPIGFFF